MSLGKIVSGSFDVLIGGEQAARKGDLIDHTGLLTTGCPTVVINGGSLLAARVSDLLRCPSTDGKPHTGGVVQPGGCPTVIIGGLPAARRGDATLCVGPGADDGSGVGGGGGGSAQDAKADCIKLWKDYQEEARTLIEPAGEDHRERNTIISAAYADLCLKNPEFRWAGLAAYASKQVGCAMDYALKMRAIGGSAGAAGAGTMAVPVLVGGAAVSASAHYTYEMLGTGNRNLFLDIYPMHRFFQDHGYEKLSKCAGERMPPIPLQALDGFRALDLHKKTGDKKYLNQSVESLAWHEQVNVLQRDIYNDWTMRKILRANETGMWGTMPADVVMDSGCTDTTGGKHTHTFGDKGRRELYDVSERMDWIVNDIARDYATFAGSQRHIDDLEAIRRQGEMAGGSFP